MVTKRKSKVDNDSSDLSVRQLAFCHYYAEDPNGTQAAIKAGYKETTANVQASRLLTNVSIQEKIKSLRDENFKRNQATASEVMNYLTKVMRGEIKDQFGLEAPLSERTKAAQELAKRTIDIDNKLAGKSANDNTIKIEIDWTRPETEQKE
jgi:phage terminase small subunit